MWETPVPTCLTTITLKSSPTNIAVIMSFRPIEYSNSTIKFRSVGGKIIMNRLGGVLAVTRAFGDISLKNNGLISKPDIKRIPIRLHHRYVILATDGLWDYVPLKKVQKIIKEEI